MPAADPTTPTGETRTALVRRARRMHRLLAETYPDAHCELDFTTPLELLVATVLSAQCTDQRVNKVTPALFARYPDAAALSAAAPEEIASPSSSPSLPAVCCLIQSPKVAG